MSSTSRPDGQVPPALDDINTRIRHLMEQPADERQAEEYARLLVLWAEATAGHDRPPQHRPQSAGRRPAWVPRRRGAVRPNSSSAKDVVTVSTATDTGRRQLLSCCSAR
jgi:hypothetical protein